MLFAYTATTLEIGSVTPEVGCVTPEVGSVTPEVGSVTPEVGCVTPEVGCVTPEVGCVTPVQRSVVSLSVFYYIINYNKNCRHQAYIVQLTKVSMRFFFLISQLLGNNVK